jgi:hypothetical protein
MLLDHTEEGNNVGVTSAMSKIFFMIYIKAWHSVRVYSMHVMYTYWVGLLKIYCCYRRSKILMARTTVPMAVVIIIKGNPTLNHLLKLIG